MRLAFIAAAILLASSAQFPDTVWVHAARAAPPAAIATLDAA